jgi:ribosome-associated heat shock protein Hsp15
MTETARMRLDKWLWAARLHKTRTLAAEEIERGRVTVNGSPAKPSRELRVGDRVAVRTAGLERELEVLGLSLQRGPAPVAQALYAETEESRRRRALWLEQRRQGVEPALAQSQGRPTKRDRRAIVDWERWGASLDEPPGKP